MEKTLKQKVRKIISGTLITLGGLGVLGEGGQMIYHAYKVDYPDSKVEYHKKELVKHGKKMYMYFPVVAVGACSYPSKKREEEENGK